jgi:hypothetical protein
MWRGRGNGVTDVWVCIVTSSSGGVVVMLADGWVTVCIVTSSSGGVVVMLADGWVTVAPLDRVPGPRVSVDTLPVPVSSFEGQSFAPQR